MKLDVVERKAAAKSFPFPILFVHGAWHGAWCWEENFMPYFAERGFDCCTFSLRGHGASGCEGYFHLAGCDDYVADLAEVVEQIGTDPVLVGHSMGGLIVQRYLETHRAPAMVLLASIPPRGDFSSGMRYCRRRPKTFLKYLATMNPRTLVATPELAREMFFSSDIPSEKLDRYFSKLGNESERANIDMMALRLPRADRVRGIPVLVLGAANDMVFSPREVEATARAYGVEAESFDDMAHDMMLEADWQSVADRIMSWLREREL